MLVEQTHQPSPTFVKFRLSIICQLRHYYISEDKNVPLTCSPTPHIPCSLFFFSYHVTLPPHLILSSVFTFPILASVPPNLPSPLISFGLWSHLRRLIHCSRSIERLSVRRSHTPHSPPPQPPPPMSPQTADTQSATKLAFYIPYWRASPPPLSAHSPPPHPPYTLFFLLWITFHLCTSKKARHLNGLLTDEGNRGFF